MNTVERQLLIDTLHDTGRILLWCTVAAFVVEPLRQGHLSAGLSLVTMAVALVPITQAIPLVVRVFCENLPVLLLGDEITGYSRRRAEQEASRANTKTPRS